MMRCTCGVHSAKRLVVLTGGPWSAKSAVLVAPCLGDSPPIHAPSGARMADR